MSEPRLELLDNYVHAIETSLDLWARDLGADFNAIGDKLNGTTIDRLVRPRVEDLMRDPDFQITGGGFLANGGLLDPGQTYIAWWQGSSLDRVDALANYSLNSQSRYLKSEWYRKPLETGELSTTGPYVDLLCTDEFVVTFTKPVRWTGQPSIAGIVGVDVTVQSLESITLPILRQLGPNAMIVNSEGRVVVSVSPLVDSGRLISIPEGTPHWPAGSQMSIYEKVPGLAPSAA